MIQRERTVNPTTHSRVGHAEVFDFGAFEVLIEIKALQFRLQDPSPTRFAVSIRELYSGALGNRLVNLVIGNLLQIKLNRRFSCIYA